MKKETKLTVGTGTNMPLSPSDKTCEHDVVKKYCFNCKFTEKYGMKIEMFNKHHYVRLKDVDKYLTSATIKAKTEYKEAILGEIDGMFDGYMGVETITINELEGIMKKQLEEPNSCR